MPAGPMSADPSSTVRRATLTDAGTIGRLLHDFNREYDDPTPEPDVLADRIRDLLAGDEIIVLLAGQPACGVSVLRFRPSIWTQALECYLAELYVVPDRRGQGIGRALMDASIELARAAGADYMDLNTSETDVVARKLYESLGFNNTEGKPDGPTVYYYEREL